jgi:hypothetical protein
MRFLPAAFRKETNSPKYRNKFATQTSDLHKGLKRTVQYVPLALSLKTGTYIRTVCEFPPRANLLRYTQRRASTRNR